MSSAFTEILGRFLIPNRSFTSYSVYIGILIFYFIAIYFTFPETKKLSAEQASTVFDMTKGARMRSSPGSGTDEREVESLEYAEKENKAEVEEIEKKG